MKNKKRSYNNIKCPKCRNKIYQFSEEYKSATNYEVINGILQNGIESENVPEQIGVWGCCQSCGHYWRITKMRNILDFKEYEDMDSNPFKSDFD